MSPAPTRLPSTVPIRELAALAGAGPGVFGIWVRSAGSRVRLYRLHLSGHPVLVSSDLGNLLRQCRRVAVRQQGRIVALDITTLITWRVLQIITASPHLPELDRLQALLPELRVSGAGIRVPLGGRSAEEVLAACVAAGVRVAASRVGYRIG